MSSRKRSLAWVAPLLVAGALLLGGWMWLGNYTRHNVKVRVPDLRDMTVEEARAILRDRGLQAEVIDSVYNDDARKGTVVFQDPVSGHEVKPGRKIYLTMNARMPKMLDMPELVNLSKRQAISTLEIIGLKVRELSYKPDPCVDCVIAQLYKGKPIAPDEKIRRGEAITLVLGSGDRGERVPVPDLRGSTNAEVQAILNMASLNLGVIAGCRNCNNKADSAFARVYRQSPEPHVNNSMGLGGMIDIWLTADTSGLRPAVNWKDSLLRNADTLGTRRTDGKN